MSYGFTECLHFFFKVLGILLFLIEIIWFIALPVVHETGYWWKNRKKIVIKTAVLRVGLVSTSMLSVLFIPFDSKLELPAVARAQIDTVVYSPLTSARISRVHVKQGQKVRAGDLLITMDSPDLEQEIQQLRLQIGLYQKLLTREAANLSYSQLSHILRRQLISFQEQLAGKITSLNQLTLTALSDGHISFVSPLIREDLWVNNKEPLVRMINAKEWKVDAYVPASDVDRIAIGHEGVFYPDDLTLPPTPTILGELSPTTDNRLDSLYLSSEFGGPIPVLRNSRGEAVLIEGFYKIEFVVSSKSYVEKVLTGSLHIKVEERSLASYVWERAWGVLIREFGV